MSKTGSKSAADAPRGPHETGPSSPRGGQERQRLAILLYHHVGSGNAKSRSLSLTVSPSRFKRQVRWLKWRGYTSITPRQWLHSCTTGALLPEKLVIFTFDDAYADIGTYALPVLEKYGFTAAIYVITGLLGQSLRWDGLPVMTLEQLRHWASRGFEIGAHTRTHPQLTALSDAGVLEEVQGSKDDLTQAGFPLCSFAYPYGIYDDRVRESLRAIFSLALTCEEGLNDSSTDRLEMKRLMMHPSDTLLDLEFRASTGRSPLDPIRSRVRLRSRVKNALRRLKVLLRHRPM